MVVTARGDLYAFGRQGVNGVDGERDIFEPEQVVLPTESGGVTQASASWFYTLVSTRSGDVYEFGGQRYGGASQATPSRVVRSTRMRSYSPVAGDANLHACYTRSVVHHRFIYPQRWSRDCGGQRTESSQRTATRTYQRRRSDTSHSKMMAGITVPTDAGSLGE